MDEADGLISIGSESSHNIRYHNILQLYNANGEFAGFGVIVMMTFNNG